MARLSISLDGFRVATHLTVACTGAAMPPRSTVKLLDAAANFSSNGKNLARFPTLAGSGLAVPKSRAVSAWSH
jgi:hypothetical protein